MSVADEPVLHCAFCPERPLLLWDGQCRFCQRWAARLKRLLGARLDCAPYQQRLADFPEIAPEQFDSAVFLILPDGAALHSAAAVYRALALHPLLALPYKLYRTVPVFARWSERCYRKVAQRRRCRL